MNLSLTATPVHQFGSDLVVPAWLAGFLALTYISVSSRVGFCPAVLTGSGSAEGGWRAEPEQERKNSPAGTNRARDRASQSQESKVKH